MKDVLARGNGHCKVTETRRVTCSGKDKKLGVPCIIGPCGRLLVDKDVRIGRGLDNERPRNVMELGSSCLLVLRLLLDCRQCIPGQQTVRCQTRLPALCPHGACIPVRKLKMNK